MKYFISRFIPRVPSEEEHEVRLKYKVNNAEKFKDVFGLYATELWSMPEKKFLDWLNNNYTCIGSIKLFSNKELEHLPCYVYVERCIGKNLSMIDTYLQGNYLWGNVVTFQNNGFECRLISLPIHEYNKTWRCWSEKPTEEESCNYKWEEEREFALWETDHDENIL